MRSAIVALLFAGCSFPTPSEQYACVVTQDCANDRICDQGYCIVATGNPIDSPPSDVPSDTGPRFDCTMWTPKNFDACMIPQPTGPLALTGTGNYTYDTANGSLTDPLGMVTEPPNMIVTAGRVLSIDSLEVGPGAIVRVIGPRPLIVAAWTTVSVAGTINAGSDVANNGAGANPATCAARLPQVGGSSGNGAGGGGGGGFGGVGGTGGNGDAAGGGNGGVGVLSSTLLGGCAGATGGTGDAVGGGGGAGGGAVQLTARMALTITATGKVSASGAGGGGAPANGGNDAQGGGGGGGTGGVIALQGATITLDAGAVVAANGGGGGGGASQGAGGRGNDGLLSAVRATGGTASNAAGQGGLGGALMNKNGGGGQNSASWGGGGGGGSTGFILFTSTTPATVTPGAIVSPVQTVVP